MAAVFRLNKGTDFKASFNWPDGAGGNANLTGSTVEIYDAPAELAGLTATLTSPAVGLIALAMKWNGLLPLGQTASFRIKIVSADLTEATTNQIWFDVI